MDFVKSKNLQNATMNILQLLMLLKKGLENPKELEQHMNRMLAYDSFYKKHRSA